MTVDEFFMKFLESLQVDLFKQVVKDSKIQKPWVYQIEKCETTEEIKALLLNALREEYDIETDFLYSLLNSKTHTKVVEIVVPKWGENILN
jgi:hypothetical protein